jgi:PAS domain S-box-containing protein
MIKNKDKSTFGRERSRPKYPASGSGKRSSFRARYETLYERCKLERHAQHRAIERLQEDLDKANRELAEMCEFAGSVFQTSGQPLVVLDSNLRIRNANDAFRNMFGVPFLNEQNPSFFHINEKEWDDPALRIHIEEMVQSDAVLENFEVERRFKKSGYRVLLLTGRRILRKSEGIPVVLLSISDITDRKRLEELSLHMKEIHHRVKNNFQVVTSLLKLQSRFVHDRRARAALRESENRVRSMAVIHEKLCESTEAGKILFRECVGDLVNHLSLLYRTDSKKVKVFVDVRNVYLEMERAIPCCLIVNELLSNVFKYAFPGGRTGTVNVRLDCNKPRMGGNRDGYYILSVSDDGIGLPEKLDLEKTESMGLQLVRSLTDQLEGTFELDRQPGATFRILFPAVIGQGRQPR